MAEPDGLRVAKVVIERRLTEDGDDVYVRSIPSDMPLIEVVGMLGMATAIVVDDAWHGDADEQP